MKKIIYIDNSENDEGDFHYARQTLKQFGILQKFGNKIETIYNLGNLLSANLKEMQKLIFNPEIIICTWSSYTRYNETDSKNQILYFLIQAAIENVKDKIYICCTGYLKEMLENHVKESTETFNIFQAIETNFILTKDENFTLKRLRIDLKGKDKECFKYENFNIDLL